MVGKLGGGLTVKLMDVSWLPEWQIISEKIIFNP